ncbi:MAG TPA: hypothetical protein V6D07_06110 [Trichocoleus sp.]
MTIGQDSAYWKSDLNKILDDTQNRNNPIALARNEISALVEARL